MTGSFRKPPGQDVWQLMDEAAVLLRLPRAIQLINRAAAPRALISLEQEEAELMRPAAEFLTLVRLPCIRTLI
ncbi:hypothetical protein NDU88_006512 [Pleurodeles waltl]|uniref:Uncharacterized protein n=1 Tax=Pleurodeles waltl TaxID=8319 RepID=A0AAV7TYR0_PLEWA|nr:hypothetical protein NDU88_006512 [Pleurodeles waltl]